jgi:hypothetical protein
VPTVAVDSDAVVICNPAPATGDGVGEVEDLPGETTAAQPASIKARNIKERIPEVGLENLTCIERTSHSGVIMGWGL